MGNELANGLNEQPRQQIDLNGLLVGLAQALGGENVEGGQPGHYINCSMKMLHKMKTFKLVTTNAHFKDALEQALGRGDSTQTTKLLAFYLKCIIEDKHKGALDILPKLLKSMEPLSALDLFKTKISKLTADFESRESEGICPDVVASCAALAFFEVASLIPNIRNAQANSAVHGDCTKLSPLFTWPSFMGKSILSLNIIATSYIELAVVTGQNKAIKVLFCGSLDKISKLTYKQLMEEVSSAVGFSFKIYDPVTDSIIREESSPISGPPNVKLKSFKALPTSTSSYNKLNWIQDKNIGDISYRLEGQISAGSDPEYVLSKLTDIDIYGKISTMKPQIITIKQSENISEHFIENALGEKFSVGNDLFALPLTYERTATYDHSAIYELC